MNLMRDYENIVNLVVEYYDYEKCLERRVTNPVYLMNPKYLISAYQASYQFYKLERSSKSQAKFQGSHLISKYLCSEDEKKSKFHKIFTSKQRIHTLGKLVIKEHPNLDYQKLLNISEVNENKSHYIIDILNAIGVLAGVASVLISLAPSDYLNQEIKYNAFWVIVITSIFFSISWVFDISGENKNKLNISRTKNILKYIIESKSNKCFKDRT